MKKKFAFMVHPRDLGDVVQYSPAAAGKRPELVRKVLEWMPPHHLSHITGVRSASTGEEIEGDFVSMPLLPEQILSLDRRSVVERVVKAAQLAQELGAQIVGLGGYTAVVGGSGKIVSQKVDIPVTSGNCYTVAIALEAVTRLADVLDLDLRRSSVCVVGATGSIGAVCALELARRVGSVVLLARSRSRLQQLADRIHRETPCAVGLEQDVERGLREADIIVSATSSGGGLIQTQFLKPGTVVCDIGVPHDVSEEAAHLRPDILVIEGGMVEAPGDPEFNFDFGYPKSVCMACMAETMALTLENRFENFSIGRGLEYEHVVEIAALAGRHGFRLAGFRSFGRPVTRDRLDEFREESRRARRGLRVVR
ncbi:MAG: shikimate dehydrogenase [Armatimonadetes bacterium]|nr:shikimate dehydrogenase [Armatimonadota bacterium]